MNIEYYRRYEPIDGKWYITKELGSGSFGTVFEIERKDFPDMKAALKVISIPSNQNEVNSCKAENYDLDEKSITSYFKGIVDEVTKEFRLMAQLKGYTNIVGYEDHDVKQKDGILGWDIFIRMELLTPMNKYFAENNPTQKDVIKLGIDICRALEVCQKYRIIHRDIKPSNIFVSKTGDFKLGDFGVARTLEKTSSGLSKKGTYTYMAPEVFKGDAYSSNVDIYSLGIVMYKLLNNNLEPFRKDRTYLDGEKAFEKRIKGKNIPLPANEKGRLAEIVLKACSFNPKDRYESPLQMREELENIIYDDGEKNIIYPEGDYITYESSINQTEEDNTVALLGECTEQNDNEESNRTVGLFDNEKTNVEIKENADNKFDIRYNAVKANRKINILNALPSCLFALSFLSHMLVGLSTFQLIFALFSMVPLIIMFLPRKDKFRTKNVAIEAILHLASGIYVIINSFILIMDMEYSSSSIQVFIGNFILSGGILSFSIIVLSTIYKKKNKQFKPYRFLWIVPSIFVMIRLSLYTETEVLYQSVGERYMYELRLITLAAGYAIGLWSYVKGK